MFNAFKNTYEYFLLFPDRVYPFASVVGGKRVRGRRSYEQACTRAFRKYGVGRLSYKLLLYRELLHFIGSILFIIAAALISRWFFDRDSALYVLLGAAIVALSFQEFYLHPKKYKQRLPKGIFDWMAWVVPMVAYIFFFLP